MTLSRIFLLNQQVATETIAANLASVLSSGWRIYLSGDLGSGKTCFARALLRESGIIGRVCSPSFTLVESYNNGKFNFYHFDFYRFSTPHEWLEAGFREYFSGEGITLLEWPEHASDLPDPDLHLYFRLPINAVNSIVLEETDANVEERELQIDAITQRGKEWLKQCPDNY